MVFAFRARATWVYPIQMTKPWNSAKCIEKCGMQSSKEANGTCPVPLGTVVMSGPSDSDGNVLPCNLDVVCGCAIS